METAIHTAGETAVYTAADTAFLTVDQAAVRIALYLHIRYISWGINCSGAKFEVFLYGLFRKKTICNISMQTTTSFLHIFSEQGDYPKHSRKLSHKILHQQLIFTYLFSKETKLQDSSTKQQVKLKLRIHLQKN